MGPKLCGFQDHPSLLDTEALAEIVHTLHDEVDAFVRKESDKATEQETRNQQIQKEYREAMSMVRTFLEEFMPKKHLKTLLGDGEAGKDKDDSDADDNEEAKEVDHEKFAKTLLPEFLRYVTEDLRAMQDALELLATFVQRHFRGDKDMMNQINKPTPVPLFQSLLRAISSELGIRSGQDRRNGRRGGGDRDDREGDRDANGEGGARDRERKRGDSRSRPERSRSRGGGRSRSRGGRDCSRARGGSRGRAGRRPPSRGAGRRADSRSRQEGRR